MNESKANGPVSSHQLLQMTCPVCGKSMSHGYIAGHWVRLRWTLKEKTQTVFAGEKLRKAIYWWGAPNVEAMRCEECKIGVFRYDY